MALMTEILKYQAASYTHLEAICRPSNTKLDFYITHMETVELETGECATRLTLGQKLKHPFYGELSPGAEVIIRHRLHWEDRLQYGSAKAWFKDQIIDHPKSAMITLYEPEISDMDHLTPIPVFWLKEAPLDYTLPEVLDTSKAALVFNGKQVLMQGKEVSGASVLFQLQRIKKESEDLRGQTIELKRQALNWHQKAIRLEEVNDQLKNELHAVLSSKSNMKESVIEQVLTALEAHTKIHNAYKALQGTNWLTRTVVIAIVAIALVGAFLLNPNAVTNFLSDRMNQMFIIILAAIGAFAVYMIKRRGK